MVYLFNNMSEGGFKGRAQSDKRLHKVFISPSSDYISTLMAIVIRFYICLIPSQRGCPVCLHDGDDNGTHCQSA